MPLPDRVITTVGSFDQVYFVVCTVDAGDASGSYYARLISEYEAIAFVNLLHDLSEALLGRDPLEIRNLQDSMVHGLRYSGRSGLALAAVAALDTCLWDLRGHLSGEPLWRMLGGTHLSTITACHSGLFLSSSITDLQKEAAKAVSEQGFRVLKMRVGKASGNEDAERVAAVKSEIGPDVELIVDAVLAWDRATAIERIRQLSQYDIAWVEDPVDYQEGINFDDLVAVRTDSDATIASGHFLSGLPAYVSAIDHKCIDILMPDLARLGGVTPWYDLTVIAASRKQRLIAHVFHEVAVHFAALTPPSSTPLIDYLFWSNGLYLNPMEVREGNLVLPDSPGIGCEFDWKKVDALTAHSPAVMKIK